MSISLINILLCSTIWLGCDSQSFFQNHDEEEVCYKDGTTNNECGQNENPISSNRYIFYDVNPSEGFNLRRDVYRRFAVLARQLATSNNPKLKNFKLVLPPWSHLYHWSYSDVAELIPWGYYFDLSSMRSYAPVIEMYEFFEDQPKDRTKIVIDEVYVLKNYDEMMRSGKFVYKQDVGDCLEEERITYFYFTNITSKNIKCLKFHGPATHLAEILLASPATTILFTHGEVALHPTFGDAIYWAARRSLRYNAEMRAVASTFRRAYLASYDEADNVHLPAKWEDEKPRRNAIGGPYLAIHLRRRDFFIGRPKELPTLEWVAKQISRHLQKLGLSVVFLSTDAPRSDVEILRVYLPKNVLLLTYTPERRFHEKYRDGGTAVIDQLVCAHARFFVGTVESTFTFRIFEEREILGFPVETTFNYLCADENSCKKPSVWKIVY